VVWLYHSHGYEARDTDAVLIGAIVVTKKGMARPDGSPKDVDREFVPLSSSSTKTTAGIWTTTFRPSPAIRRA
jgi:hypothetical protein